MAKLSLLLILLIFLSGSALGVRFAYSNYFCADPDDHECDLIFLVDTGSDPDSVQPILHAEERRIGVIDEPNVVAFGPDEKIYYTYEKYTTGVAETLLRRITPTSHYDPSSGMSFGTSEQVASLSCPREDEPACRPLDWAVRRLDSGDLRIYYSADARGAAGEPKIYYLDDAGNPVLYYSVDLATLPACNGSGYWSGHFTFDDSNNLYLSSGNHLPASIFRISGAGPDAVTGEVEQIYLRGCEILGLDFAGPRYIYFVSNGIICQLDLETNEEQEIYVSPSSSRSMADLAVIEGHAKSVIPGITLMSSEKWVKPDDKIQSGDKKKVAVASSQSKQEIQTSIDVSRRAVG